jgi:capsular polysaccharide export protein
MPRGVFDKTGRINEMTRRLLILVDNLPRARFFIRFERVLRAQQWQPIYLCYKASAFTHIRAAGGQASLLRLSDKRRVATVDEEVCARSLDVLRGDIGMRAALKKAKLIVPALLDSLEACQPERVFLWNGSQLVERLMTSQLPPQLMRQYFEIANIPGKMFVDEAGVNAASSIYHKPQVLEATEAPSEQEYRVWREKYLDQKRGGGVPQAKVAQSLPWERPFDVIASMCGRGFYQMQVNRMALRIQGKLKAKALMETLHRRYPPRLNQRPYIFLPFQVSEDTQLLLNSDVANVRALEIAAEEARAKGHALIAKIHPAENSVAALRELEAHFARVPKEVDLTLSTVSTTELIGESEGVVTINSTVGLETLIIGKPLKVLGRALFTHFIDRPDLLRIYLLRYLVPIDYFSDSPITQLQLEAVLQRRAGVPCTIY